MGSSFDAIRDDENEYRRLCIKHNEKRDEVYTNHYYWLLKKNEGLTQSFENYCKEVAINSIEYLITQKEKELKELNIQLKKLNT